MARGKGRGHKGQRRRFTNPEELAKQTDEPKLKDEEESESSEDDSQSESDQSDDSFADDKDRHTGVAGLIEIDNPNRVVKRQPKLDKLDISADGPELSRREREELEKRRVDDVKTDQMRADMARLTLIRQQREEAARRRENERKQKELEKVKKRPACNSNEVA